MLRRGVAYWSAGLAAPRAQRFAQELVTARGGSVVLVAPNSIVAVFRRAATAHYVAHRVRERYPSPMGLAWVVAPDADAGHASGIELALLYQWWARPDGTACSEEFLRQLYPGLFSIPRALWHVLRWGWQYGRDRVIPLELACRRGSVDASRFDGIVPDPRGWLERRPLHGLKLGLLGGGLLLAATHLRTMGAGIPVQGALVVWSAAGASGLIYGALLPMGRTTIGAFTLGTLVVAPLMAAQALVEYGHPNAMRWTSLSMIAVMLGGLTGLVLRHVVYGELDEPEETWKKARRQLQDAAERTA